MIKGRSHRHRADGMYLSGGGTYRGDGPHKIPVGRRRQARSGNLARRRICTVPTDDGLEPGVSDVFPRKAHKMCPPLQACRPIGPVTVLPTKPSPSPSPSPAPPPRRRPMLDGDESRRKGQSHDFECFPFRCLIVPAPAASSPFRKLVKHKRPLFAPFLHENP